MAYGYYGPGWYPQPPPFETKKGLKHIVRAMYLSLIIMVLALIIVAVALTSLSDIGDIQTDEDLGPAIGALAILGISALVLLVVGLATLIYYLMGLVEMNRGRHEFGPVHAARVQRAILLIVLAIVITIVGAGVSTAILFDSSTFISQGSSADWEQYRQNLIMSSAIGGIFSIVSAVFWNLAVVNLVRELVDDRRRGYLWMGFGIGVASSAGSTALSVALVAFQAEDALAGFNNSNYLSFLPVGISFITFVIYLMCYKHALGRLESGELRPMQPPAPPMPQYPPGAYYPPPGYYPAPPPYGQPPPMQQPPPYQQAPQYQQPPPVPQQTVQHPQQQASHPHVQPQPVAPVPVEARPHPEQKTAESPAKNEAPQEPAGKREQRPPKTDA